MEKSFGSHGKLNEGLQFVVGAGGVMAETGLERHVGFEFVLGLVMAVRIWRQTLWVQNSAFHV